MESWACRLASQFAFLYFGNLGFRQAGHASLTLLPSRTASHEPPYNPGVSERHHVTFYASTKIDMESKALNLPDKGGPAPTCTFDVRP